MFDVAAIDARVQELKENPEFRGREHWWLTLCISGSARSLEQVAALERLGGLNLVGTETGSLNAKLLTLAEPGAIAERITTVRRIATGAGAERSFWTWMQIPRRT